MLSILYSSRSRMLMSAAFIILQVNLINSELADYMTICSAKDPELSKCLANSALELVKNMKGGIPEFDIPPIDPFFVSKAEFLESRLGVNLTFFNSSITGIEGIKFTNARCVMAFHHPETLYPDITLCSAKPENYSMEFRYNLPHQTLTGFYLINGKIMMLPIVGRGSNNITMIDVDITWKISGKPEVKDKITFMKLLDFQTKVVPKSMKVNFENLFNGHKLIGNTMNDILNTNWKDLYKFLQPKIEKLYSTLFFKIADNIFSKTPYDHIFSDL